MTFQPLAPGRCLTDAHSCIARGPDLTDAHDKHAPGGGRPGHGTHYHFAASRGSTINQSAPSRTLLSPGGVR